MVQTKAVNNEVKMFTINNDGHYMATNSQTKHTQDSIKTILCNIAL